MKRKIGLLLLLLMGLINGCQDEAATQAELTAVPVVEVVVDQDDSSAADGAAERSESEPAAAAPTPTVPPIPTATPEPWMALFNFAARPDAEPALIEAHSLSLGEGRAYWLERYALPIDPATGSASTAVVVYAGDEADPEQVVRIIELDGSLTDDSLQAAVVESELASNGRISHPLVDAYAAAGFDLRATREFYDGSGNRYLSLIVFQAAEFRGLVFEEVDGAYEFVYELDLPPIPARGQPLDFWLFDTSLTFEDIWLPGSTTLTPATAAEKALLAIGCDTFDREFMPAEAQLEVDGDRRDLLLYSCTLFGDPNGFEVISANYVVVVQADEDVDRPFFARWFPMSATSEWVDIESDGAPELYISTYRFVNDYIPLGDYLYQIDESLTLQNILTDPLVINELQGAGEFGGGRLEDLDGDGELEYVIRYGNSFAFGAYSAAAKTFSAVRGIYRLEGSQFERVNRDYGALCQSAIGEMQNRQVIPGSTDGMTLVYESLSMLLTCSAVGQADLGFVAFNEMVNPAVYPPACGRWLTTVYQTLQRIQFSEQQYWADENLDLLFTGVDMGLFQGAENRCQITADWRDYVSRSRTQWDVLIPYLNDPVMVDGQLDEWPAAVAAETIYRVAESSSWDGTDDLESAWRLGWNDSGLYFGVEVIDDVHAQNQVGDQIWQGDGVEVQFDMLLSLDLFEPAVDGDDFQIIVSPGNFDDIPPSYYLTQSLRPINQIPEAVDPIEVASVQTSTGYQIEFKIPWEILLLIQGNPENRLIGLNLNVSDNDARGEARQEVMYSHVESRSFANPTTWGTALIGADPTHGEVAPPLALSELSGNGSYVFAVYEYTVQEIQFQNSEGNFETRRFEDSIAVATMEADGKAFRVLVPGRTPEVSPEGDQIAFAIGRDNPAVFVMDWDGSNIRQVSPQGESGQNPIWSADGQKLTYSTPNGWVTTDLETGETQPSRSNYQPYVATDGPYAGWRIESCFQDLPEGQRKADVCLQKEGETVNLTEAIFPYKGMYAMTDGWSPDHNYIVFGDLYELYVIEIATGRYAKLPIPVRAADAHWRSN